MYDVKQKSTQSIRTTFETTDEVNNVERMRDQRGDALSLQRMVGNRTLQRFLKGDVAIGKARGITFSPQRYVARQCSGSGTSSGTGISPTQISALGHSFRLHRANASVVTTFPPPHIEPFGGAQHIYQDGASFSFSASVEDLQPNNGHYRLGLIQTITSSQRRAHYVDIRNGVPLGSIVWNNPPGLDMVVGSTPPWYNSQRLVSLDPRGLGGDADTPGGTLPIIVDGQGGWRNPSPPRGKLSRYTGCSRYISWIVIEAPGGRGREAIAWVTWVASFEIDYNIRYNAASASSSIVSAAPASSLGWLTSAPQLGSGPTIPGNISRRQHGTWTSV